MIRDSSVGYIVMILVSYLVYTMGLTNESARKQVRLYQHKMLPFTLTLFETFGFDPPFSIYLNFFTVPETMSRCKGGQ